MSESFFERVYSVVRKIPEGKLQAMELLLIILELQSQQELLVGL